MKATSRFGLLSIALAFAAALCPSAARADSYTIFTLDSDEARFFRGMDANGTVILSYDVSHQTTCNVYEPGCFRTYTDGQLVAQANTMPSIAADNGTPCTPTVPPGAIVVHGVCNNGYDAFMGYMTAGQLRPSLYLANGTLLASEGTGAFVFMNGEGDVVWNDPSREFWYEAINTTTHVPEPASLTLLATGALAALGAARRRLA